MGKKFFGEMLEKFQKTLFFFPKVVYNNVHTTAEAQEKSDGRGEDEMAGDSKKQTQKAAKKRPSGKLTAIILLALFLGVGIQF